MSLPTNHKVILACDPGYDRLGVAVLSGTVHSSDLLFSTCLQTEKTDPLSVRLGMLQKELSVLLKKYSPDVIAVETLFFANNKKSALSVAEARGMILALAGSNDIPVIEHSPQEVKIAVTGYGNAVKKDVMLMTRRLVPNIKEGALDDEIDAIALGICTLASYKK